MNYVKKIDKVMSQIAYGWVDKNGERHEDLNGYSENYMLQTADELKKSKLGVCWDQVELERKLFADEGIDIRTFFIVHYDDDHCPTHTFAIFADSGKTYWYEHSWAPMRGLHEYNDFDEALNDIRARFIDGELHGKYDPDQLIIYEYPAPNGHLSCPEFYAHCESGKVIELNK